MHYGFIIVFKMMVRDGMNHYNYKVLRSGHSREGGGRIPHTLVKYVGVAIFFFSFWNPG